MIKNDYIQKLTYYKNNPDIFIEEFYNIKLLPFQKILIRKMIKEEKNIYITMPRFMHYSNTFIKEGKYN